MASLRSLIWAILASTSVRDTSAVCLLNVLAEEFRTFCKASKPFKIASFVRPPCDWAVARAALYLNALSVMTEVSGAAKASILASSGTAERSGCHACRLQTRLPRVPPRAFEKKDHSNRRTAPELGR